MVIREGSHITDTVRNATGVVHSAAGTVRSGPVAVRYYPYQYRSYLRGGAGPIRNYSVTVPEQFVALPGGAGVVNKFRLSEQIKNTRDGPDHPDPRRGPGPSGGGGRSTSVFGVTVALMI